MRHARTRVALPRHPGGVLPAGVALVGLLTAALALVPTRAMAAAPPAPGGQALQPVSLRLVWLYQGPNSGFMAAREKVYYKDVGLDVTVAAGKGSVNTAQLVASKSDMFGYSDGYVVGTSVAKGMPIRMVANVTRRTPTAAIVMADSDIKTPKDLEGKTVGIPPGGGPYHQWPAYLKGCGIDSSKIKVAAMDPATAPSALIQGRVDGIVGFVNGFVPLIESRSGKKARFFPYADCGVSNVSLGVIVHNDLIKENPDLIRRFVAASMKGFLYVTKNREEAGQIVKKYLETVNPATATRELELSLDFYVTPNTKGMPFGWMSDKDWEDTVRILKEYGGVTTPLEAKQLYTNEFVPTSAEYNYPQ